MKFKKINNKKVFLIITIIVLLAYTMPAISKQEIKHSDTNHVFMWAVEAGQTNIYLLGSIHILKPDFYPLPSEIEDAYRKSEQIVFEANLDELNTPSAQQKILTLGLYQGEDTLMQHLSKPIQEQLQKKITQLNLPLSNLNKFRPWFCAITLMVIEFQRLGFNPQLGIDQHFFQKTKIDRKKTLFLETADFQIDLMSGLSSLEQERMLGQTLKDLEVIEKYTSDMEAAWKSGDDWKLNTILAESFQEYPKIYDKFILNRNKDWVLKIIDIINQKQDTLIIVGAGHLVGDKSVLMMLKNKGYTIKQISSATH